MSSVSLASALQLHACIGSQHKTNRPAGILARYRNCAKVQITGIMEEIGIIA